MVRNSPKRKATSIKTAISCTSVFLAFAFLGSERSLAGNLVDPPILESHTAILDVLMVARPQILPFTGQPTGYV
jgi:hypothetical protein